MKKPTRLKHLDRRTKPSRTYPARVFRVSPDPALPYVVEVRIARTRRHMRSEIDRMEGIGNAPEVECMGLVRSWHNKIRGNSMAIRGMIVARVFLNVPDLREKPGEIVSHECTHAGMAWARMRGANLGVMPGEEVLCYAVGRMVSQVNRVCYAAGVWR